MSYIHALFNSCLFFIIFGASENSIALTFTKGQKSGEIYATGNVVPGDTIKLKAIAESIPSDEISVRLILNSPGGNLLEGLRLGVLIRDKALETIVKKDGTCYSACAIAFLGGTSRYATGYGVGRFLEPGAKLGFHGFSAPKEQVVFLNEALNSARIINGMIVEYASRLSQVDAAILSRLITISPTNIGIVNTPKELRGLGIKIEGELSASEANWALNVCQHHVGKELDGSTTWRVTSKSKLRIIRNADELQKNLLADMSSDRTAIDSVLMNLGSDDFVKFFLRHHESRFPAIRYPLERGAGFYYDYCYAVGNRSGVTTILVDSLGGVVSTHVMFHGLLNRYADDQTLW
jgi:hypothetical protein